MDLVKGHWEGTPGTFAAALAKAKELRRSGKSLEANFLVLTAYNSESSTLIKVQYFLLVWWYARRSFQYDLTHNQLDVLLGFFMGAYTHPVAKFFSFLYPSSEEMRQLAEAELSKALSDTAKPHQRALAHVMCARVARHFIPPLTTHDRLTWVSYMDNALKMEVEVLKEEPRPQALQQWVRVLKWAGEMHTMHNPACAYTLLQRAFNLANGEADTPDQAQKILALMQQSRLEEGNKK